MILKLYPLCGFRDGSSARMSYQVQGRADDTHSDPVIAVTRQGQMISGSRTGQASLLVTALEDFGVNQSVVTLVKVVVTVVGIRFGDCVRLVCFFPIFK